MCPRYPWDEVVYQFLGFSDQPLAQIIGRQRIFGPSFRRFSYTKGVIGVQQYEGSINGPKYADIIHTHFPQLLQDGANPTGGYFVQDNDPSQNRRKARDALKEVKAYQFRFLRTRLT